MFMTANEAHSITNENAYKLAGENVCNDAVSDEEFEKYVADYVHDSLAYNIQVSASYGYNSTVITPFDMKVNDDNYDRMMVAYEIIHYALSSYGYTVWLGGSMRNIVVKW